MACSEFEERIIIARTLAVYDELVRTPVPAMLGRQLASGNSALERSILLWQRHPAWP